MPPIDRPELRQTKSHSLGPIQEDVSTIKGNLNVFINVLITQLGLTRYDSRWGKTLKLSTAIRGHGLVFEVSRKQVRKQRARAIANEIKSPK